MRQFLLLFSIIICLASVSYSQDIIWLNMDKNVHTSLLNPAAPIQKKWNIGVGSVFAGLGTDGPTINQLTLKSAENKRYINVAALSKIEPEGGNIYADAEVRTLDLSYQFHTWTIFGGHGFKMLGSLNYTKDLIGLLGQGNAPYIGKTLSIGPSINLNAYNEFRLGIQKQFNKFSIGFTGKLLYGTANLYTESPTLNMTTDAEYYQWKLDGNYQVRSSSVLRYFPNDSITFQFPQVSFDNIFYNNRGFAFDLGMTYQLTPKVLVGMSATDIGSITWDYFPRKYTIQGNYKFEGIDILSLVGDSTGISIPDSLRNIIDVNETIETYSTSLPWTLRLHADIKINDRLSVAALLQNRFYEGTRNTSLTISAMQKLSVFGLGLQYSIQKKSYNNLGVLTTIKLGPFTAYTSFSNILAAFNPLNHKNVNIRLGTLLQF